MNKLIVLGLLCLSCSAFSQQYIQDGYIYDDGNVADIMLQHQQTMQALGLDENSKQIKEMNEKLDQLLQRK